MKSKIILIALSAALLSLSSCGAKKTIQTEDYSKEVLNQKKDTLSVVIKETTKKVDTTLIVKGYESNADISEESLNKGDTLKDTGKYHETQTYKDKSTGKINTKTKIKDFEANVVIEQTDKTTSINYGSENKDLYSEDRKRVEEAERSTGIANNIIYICLFIILCALSFRIGVKFSSKLK